MQAEALISKILDKDWGKKKTPKQIQDLLKRIGIFISLKKIKNLRSTTLNRE